MTERAPDEATPHAAAGVLACVAIAALYRIVLVATFWDVPGDGPSRAAIALGWAADPQVLVCGGWPPGFSFVVGGFSRLVPWPLWTAPLLNLMLGVASVPLLYGIGARTWGPGAGLAAAAALAVLPLHAELSATSLTEISFLFTVLAGWLVLLGAASDERTPSRRGRMLAGGAILTLAAMLRYEAWILAPLWPAWWLWRRRDLRETVLLAVAVAWFPLAWTLGNARCGDAFMGFRAALQEPSAGAGFGPVDATAYLAALTAHELGTPLAVLLAIGAALEVGLACVRRTTPARLLALGVAGIAWVLLLRFAMSRGTSAWNRYAIAALVLALPLAMAPLAWLPRTRAARTLATLGVTVTLLFMLVPDVSGERPRHWLRRTPPVQAAETARWLAADPSRGTMPIVSTTAGWELWYLPLHDPSVFPRLWVVSGWISDDDVHWRVEALRGAGPFLLATRDGDEADVRRLEAEAGVLLTAGEPVFRSGPLRIHQVSLPPRGP